MYGDDIVRGGGTVEAGLSYAVPEATLFLSRTYITPNTD